MRRLLLIGLMRAVAARDRLWLRWLQWLHPGLQVDPSAASALAVARFNEFITEYANHRRAREGGRWDEAPAG